MLENLTLRYIERLDVVIIYYLNIRSILVFIRQICMYSNSSMCKLFQLVFPVV